MKVGDEIQVHAGIPPGQFPARVTRVIGLCAGLIDQPCLKLIVEVQHPLVPPERLKTPLRLAGMPNGVFRVPDFGDCCRYTTDSTALPGGIK